MVFRSGDRRFAPFGRPAAMERMLAAVQVSVYENKRRREGSACLNRGESETERWFGAIAKRF